MDPENNTTNDEAALDAELEANIASVKAGNELAVNPTVQTAKPEPTGATGSDTPSGDSTPTGATGETGEEAGNSQAPAEEQEFRIPNKGKFETDEAYEKRVELFDLVKRRQAATTPDAKAALSEKIKQTKSELKDMGISGRFNNTRTDGAPTGATGEVDPDIAADQARLKALGGATREDVTEIVRQERLAQEVQSTLQKFVNEAPELKDPDVREVFFDFVENNYVWQGKSGAELRATLGMAYENMFRPVESVQERILKAAGVAEKVNSMQFPGGTATKTSYSPEMQASIDQLKSTGMSEEKAIELLTE